MTMAAKKATKYSDYSTATQQFMNSVEKFIKRKYGKIEAHWEGQLALLATNYELFNNAKDEVKKNGMLVTNRFGGLDKNPLLRVITDSNIQCIKLIHEFGLSPSASGKIKEVESDDTDIIKGLLNG